MREIPDFISPTTNNKQQTINIFYMKKLLFVLLVLSVTLNAQVPSYVPTNGLVAYYPFNGNANDASGNGNNGVVNGATLTSDRTGNANAAYNFNGSSSLIEIPDTNKFNLSRDFTISTWVNAIEFGTQRSIVTKYKMLDDAFSFDIKNAKLSLQTASSPANWITATSNQNLQSNTWYHLVGIKDYSNRLFKLYVNGELIFQQTCNDTTSRSGANLIFGNYKNNALNPSVVFSGKLDDIAIYNRALTQSEITSLYNSNSCIANITNNDTSICRGSSITLNAATVNAASVTDINGNVYPSVNIGTQTWMQKNLNVSKYKNGDIIPQVTNATQWAALTTGAWCWYNNDSATYAATYGKLYNWYAVNDPRGLAPEGWHVPSDGEWNKLVKYLDVNGDTSGFQLTQVTQSSIMGGLIKDTGTINWLSPNTGANNLSGFKAIGSGYRDNGNNGSSGYSSLKTGAYWWSLNYIDSIGHNYRSVFNNGSTFVRFYNQQLITRNFGFSVRCLKNTPTYLWSTGATTPSISVSPTVTTKYYCTVRDGVNTCKDSVTVTVSTITTNFITADTIKVCGTSTTISATTGLASYAWSNGTNTASTNVTSSGWYTCTATNGACNAVDSVYVSLFNPKITQNDTTVCAGTPLTLTVNNNTALTSSLPANLRNGLVGYWPFNGNANDESGNGNNGTVNGATLTSDRFGNVNSAYSFDGISNFISVNYSDQFNISNRSISIWVKAPNFCGDGNPNIGMGQIGNKGWGISAANNNTDWGYADNNCTSNTNRTFLHSSCTAINPIQWNHFVFVVDSINNKGSLYFNKNLLISQTLNGNYCPTDRLAKFIIGANGSVNPTSPSDFSICQIDDISFFNRALTANEVQQLYSGTSYLWSTTATTQSINVNPTATTSYIATVSNGINTCKDTVKITVAPITTNLITADTLKVCGTSTTISATTGLASYAWSNGANTASTTVTSSGWYKCTATNGACTAVDSVYVSLFNPKITQNDTTVCAGTPLTLMVNNNTALTSSLPANLRNGLVGYWPFNGNANDESGNGNNGTVNGATLTSDRFGNVGKAYFINNQAPGITVSNFFVNPMSFSTSYWVRYSSFPTNNSISDISHDWINNGAFCSFRELNSTVGFGTPGSNGTSNNTSINSLISNDTSSWINFVFSRNDSNIYLYRNGLLVASGLNRVITNNLTKKLFFGGDPTMAAFNPNSKFIGFLDDIAIYNRALTANEVQQLYSGTSYLWSTSATTQSITVNPTATTSYIATVSNGINTCKDTVKITVANITSLAPTTIYGAVDVCASIGADTASIPVNYKINKVANAASYVWTVPAGVTLLSGQGDTSIMVRFSASFVSGAITVKSVSTCNISSAVKSVTVYKRVAAAPAVIQKEFTPTSIVATTNVSGLVSEVYRIKKVLYATSYNWYLNRGTNASITHVNLSGENDTAVIVTFASCFVKDTLSVKSVTPCSISTAKTVIMSSSTTPASVAGITTVGGDFAVCIGTSKTFTAIAGTPTTAQVRIARYRWTNPLNTIITSATSDSSSITVSFNTGFTGGSLICKGISGCGVVGTTATTAILQYLPPTPLSIGSSTNSYNACINSSVTYTALVGTATTAQAQASVFRWTKPNNTTITSAAADSSSITLRFNTGYIGGVISVKGQSRCGAQSAARSQALTHTGCALGTKISLPITTTNTASFEVSLYPNPTTNEFKLLIKNNTVVGSNKPSKAIIKVIDLQGRMMKSFTTNTNQVTAIGNELKSGVYMVEVRVGDEVRVIRAVKF